MAETTINKTNELISIIDDVKDKLTDGEYVKIMEKIMNLDRFVKVNYIKIQYDYEEEEMKTFNITTNIKLIKETQGGCLSKDLESGCIREDVVKGFKAEQINPIHNCCGDIIILLKVNGTT